MATESSGARRARGAAPPGALAPAQHPKAKAATAPPRKGRLGRTLAFLAALVVAWKLKLVLLGLLAKAKFLMLGLAQLSALFGMLLTVGLYEQRFGWKLVVGVVAALYVHELGHLLRLRRFGVPLRAAMFVPGFGAFLRADSYPAAPAADARVGLAGPVWGTAAAWALMLTGRARGWPSFVAVGHVAGWLNLLDLVPVWKVDGSRALRVLSRPHRLFLAALALLAWLVVRDGLLLVLMGSLAFRAWHDEPSPPGAPSAAPADLAVLAWFTLLLGALTLLLRVGS